MQPTPFEIGHADGGMRVASNGQVRVTLAESDGLLFKRRGVKGLSTGAAADKVLPLLNGLAGEIVAQPDMPPAELAARLHALAGSIHIAQPEHAEWAVVALDNVKVYVSGHDVVVTRADLYP